MSQSWPWGSQIGVKKKIIKKASLDNMILKLLVSLDKYTWRWIKKDKQEICCQSCQCYEILICTLLNIGKTKTKHNLNINNFKTIKILCKFISKYMHLPMRFSVFSSKIIHKTPYILFCIFLFPNFCLIDWNKVSRILQYKSMFGYVKFCTYNITCTK